MRLGILRKHQFTHPGAQTVRGDKDVGILRAPIAEAQPYGVRRHLHADHTGVEANIDAQRARSGQQDFRKKPAAKGNARSPKDTLMVRLVRKGEPPALGAQDLNAGGKCRCL